MRRGLQSTADTIAGLIGSHSLRVTLLCAAGFMRAVSSSLVWVYSTLVVQCMVLGPAGGNPWANPVFGRVFTVELSVFTAGKLASFVLGGAGLGWFACDAECAAAMLLGTHGHSKLPQLSCSV